MGLVAIHGKLSQLEIAKVRWDSVGARSRRAVLSVVSIALFGVRPKGWDALSSETGDNVLAGLVVVITRVIGTRAREL